MSDDVAALDSPSPQTGHGTSRRQVRDALVSVVLVTIHFVLYGGTFTFLGLMVMGTDTCAYQKCGDQAWLWRAMNLAGWAGGAILLADAAMTLTQLIRGRVAWFVPLIGCTAQLALAFAAVAMEMQAGPV